MRYRLPALAVGILATALAFGPAPASEAETLLPELNAFFVADADPFTVTLIADAPPELAGTDMMVLFGEAPLVGLPVGGANLVPGPNMIVTPNFGPGWFTAMGAFQAGSSLFDRMPSEE